MGPARRDISLHKKYAVKLHRGVMSEGCKVARGKVKAQYRRTYDGFYGRA